MAIKLHPKDVHKRGQDHITSPSTPNPGIKTWYRMITGLGRSIKPRELIFFTQQLSMMLEIEMSMNDALNALSNQISNPSFHRVTQQMVRDIGEGYQLSNAMKRHPKVFNNIFVSMVKAGETGGFLQQIIDRIAEMQEKRQILITQVRSALTYPLILCIIGILVVIFVVVGILPKFTTFFEGKEDILPISTRFLMMLSTSMQEYWWIYMIVFAGLAVGVKLWAGSEQGQSLMDGFCVKAPLVSRLCNKIYTGQLFLTLGCLMESKVPLLEALRVTRDTLRNRYFRNFIDNIIYHVDQGGKFTQPFATYPYILESVKQMIATAEETGKLPVAMIRLAKFYDTEVDRDLKLLSSMIEPLGLIVIGGVVGLIVASVILPMFKLAGMMH